MTDAVKHGAALMQNESTDWITLMQNEPTGGVKLMQDELADAAKWAKTEMTKFVQSGKKACKSQVEAKTHRARDEMALAFRCRKSMKTGHREKRERDERCVIDAGRRVDHSGF